jgi:hypothetical protein
MRHTWTKCLIIFAALNLTGMQAAQATQCTSADAHRVEQLEHAWRAAAKKCVKGTTCQDCRAAHDVNARFAAWIDQHQRCIKNTHEVAELRQSMRKLDRLSRKECGY